MKKHGIDVSDCQGIIDWKKAKASGVEFAILRSTRGSGKPDNYLPANIKGCLDNGIPFDFYKYSYAMSVPEARQEAVRVVEVLKDYGVKPDGNTRIWLDMEYDKQLALGSKKCMEIIAAYESEITKAGFSFGLYMGKYAYEHSIDAASLSVDVWIARYPDTSARSLKNLPNEKYKPVAKGKSTLFGWQFSSKGRIDGIKGDVDLDVAYVDIKEASVEPSYYSKPEFTLIDALNKIGVDSSYKNRQRIAERNGIAGYKGTAEQNLKILELLQTGLLKK